MAHVTFLLQGLDANDNHEDVVKQLLELEAAEEFVFSVAFARSNGVDALGGNLAAVADRCVVFLGIRNGITSIQSICSLLKLGISPYVVDTASNQKIFHPKVYAGYNASTGVLVMGSANLTFGGLNRNIEASSHISLDRNAPSDEDCLQKLVTVLKDLPNRYPDHVFKIENARHAFLLLREGRLEDERVTRLPSVQKGIEGEERDGLKPIATHERRRPGVKRVVRKPHVAPSANAGVVVWESKPLTERSLNIPRGGNTNITGDTNLTQGVMQGIDFQHYFRDDVFAELDWSTNPQSQSPHLERATINAEIVVKSISYGVYQLEVTHDPRTNTRSYEQNNAMTKIKWGDTRHIIARRDLLGRTLQLLKKGPDQFAILID